MKTYILVSIISVICSIICSIFVWYVIVKIVIGVVDKLHNNYTEKATKGKIIKQITDNRGLTSVLFVEYKIVGNKVVSDTVGLDYLTKYELDSLQKTFE